jgi:hypothetical protein
MGGKILPRSERVGDERPSLGGADDVAAQKELCG